MKTKILNQILLDTKLTYGARGLYTFGLSFNNRRHFNYQFFSDNSNEPKNRIQYYMKELERSGLVLFKCYRIGGGSYVNEWLFMRSPVPEKSRTNRTLWRSKTKKQFTPRKSAVNYYIYIHSHEWQAKRQEVFAAFGKKCNRCKKPATQIHHKTYENLGNEKLKDLEQLCASCHRKEHEIESDATFLKKH